MKKIVFITTVILALNYLFAYPEKYNLEIKQQGDISSDKNIKGNFISKIIRYDNDGNIILVTGNGLSIGSIPTTNSSSWRNTNAGKGGVSAYHLMNNNISKIDWLSTGEYNYYENIGDFQPVNNGLNFSTDEGKIWQHINPPVKMKRQNGELIVQGTPISGICYDMASDSTNHLWLACFGQSLQRISTDDMDNWQTSINKDKSINPDTLWQTIWPNDKDWSPAKTGNEDQRLFAVYCSDKGKLIAGSAGGVHILLNYDAKNIKEFEWKNFTAGEIYGNWITVIDSQIKDNGTELIWLGVWPAGDNEIYTVVNLEEKDDGSWKINHLKDFDDIKVYGFDFRGDEVFVATQDGLYYGKTPNGRFEKYRLEATSPLTGKIKEVQSTYSVFAKDNNLLVGTNEGLIFSNDNGFNFNSLEAGDSNKKSYAYPNPFSPLRYDNVKIRFEADNESEATLEIYNFAMEKARSFTSKIKYSAGDHYLLWDGKDDYGDIVANGAYFYKLKVGSKTFWNKILIFK